MAQHPIAIPDEATYAGIRSFGCSISTTLRRTCGGHHRHLHGKRNQDRLVHIRRVGQLHGFHRVGRDNESEADCPHAQSVPVSGVLLRHRDRAVLSAKPVL